MKLAVLGTDPDLLALLAAARTDGHEIAWLGDVRSQDQAAVRQFTSLDANTSSDWETLLDHATADAVLVGRGNAGDELRSEQLKRFVADAVPLLVVQPAVLSVLTYYELDMVRRETGGILRHYNPHVGHPALSDLASWVRDGHEAIGSILQVTFDHDVQNSSRETVFSGFVRDIEMLALVAGDLHYVSAVGPRQEGASFASLQVQITAAGPATVRWSAIPKSRGPEQIALTLVGEHGTIRWTQSPNTSGDGAAHAEYDLQINASESQQVSLPSFNSPQTAIRQLASAVALRDHSESRDSAERTTWSTATRAMEVLDAVELSLQKGRTIEVHQQKLTEQLAFRGTMAAMGCGLLLVVTMVMFVAGILGGVEWLLQRSLMKWWSIVLLAVLAFFLLLQIVPYLSSKRRRESAGKDDVLDANELRN